MNRESSRMTVILTDGGSVRLDRCRACARTPSITATVFSPMARRTSSMTAGVLPSQTAVVGRSKLSSARPMSETRIGVPFAGRDDDVVEVRAGVDAAERAQQQLSLALLDGAAGDLDVLGTISASRTCAIDRP